MKLFTASIQAGNVFEVYYSSVVASCNHCLEGLQTLIMGESLADEVSCMLDLRQQAHLTQVSCNVWPLLCMRQISGLGNIFLQVGELAWGLSSLLLLMMTDSSCFPVVCIIYTLSNLLKYFLL